MPVNRKYLPLVSGDQRQSYKDDFNAEYDEYRLLHARVESVTRRFSQLDAQCRKLVPGTKEHQVTEPRGLIAWLPSVAHPHRTLLFLFFYFTEDARRSLKRI